MVASASICRFPCLLDLGKMGILQKWLNSMCETLESTKESLRNLDGDNIPNPVFMSGLAWRVGEPNRNEVTPFL